MKPRRFTEEQIILFISSRNVWLHPTGSTDAPGSWESTRPPVRRYGFVGDLSELLHVNPSRRYLLISTRRDEAQYLCRTLDNMAAQLVPSALWVVVDKGSTGEVLIGSVAMLCLRNWLKGLPRYDDLEFKSFLRSYQHVRKQAATARGNAERAHLWHASHPAPRS